MRILLVADIFGTTPALIRLANELGSNTVVFDPYEGQRYKFKSEKHAYTWFTRYVGVEKYAQLLSTFLHDNPEDTQIVGFSVGASATWIVSSMEGHNGINKAVLFYGSQIRNHVDKQVNIPLHLIFPQHEPRFCVSTLIKKIVNLPCNKSVQTPLVTCEKVPYLHGFMNELSVHFNQGGLDHYLVVLKNKLDC